MMKFFRKHNKKLLAVFMTLLMIVFLGGSALDSLLTPRADVVVADSYGGPVSFSDHGEAEYTTRILERIGVDWQRPFPGLPEPLDTLDWILLTREAKNLGMAIDTGTVRYSLGGQGGINELARQLRVKPTHILRAMAEYTAVVDTARAVGGAARPSEAEVHIAARNAMEKVRVAAVLLPAGAFVDEQEELAEAEIEAQFSAYRDRERGPGLEFGYYVEPTVKVQYIKIDRDVISETVRIANLEKKARAYYDEVHEQDPAFRRPPEEPASERDSPNDDAIEGPPYEPPPYLHWEEASEIAIGIVRQQAAEEAAEQIAHWLVQYTAEPWHTVTRGDDGYKTAPQSVAQLEYYERVIENMPATIAYPEAVSVGMTDFFNSDQSLDVPEIGMASFRPERGGMPLWLRQLAFRTKAVVPKVPFDGDASPSDYLAPFQTCQYSLTDSDGNIYVFRGVDAREGHIAESVDEVRERVLEDLRVLRGYDVALARAESLRSCTDTITLQEAYESDEELVALMGTEKGTGGGYFEPPAFARVARFDAVRGERPEKTVMGGGIGPVRSEVIDQCFMLEQAYEKTTVIELKDRATAMVVEWLETERALNEEFMETREEYVQQLSGARASDAVSAWLNPDQIRARNGFKLVQN